MPNNMQEIVFTVTLTRADWNENFGGWICQALIIPGARVDAIYVQRRRAVHDHEYKILMNNIIKWTANEIPNEIVVSILLTEELSDKKQTEKWKKIAIILPPLAAILSAIITSLPSLHEISFVNQLKCKEKIIVNIRSNTMLNNKKEFIANSSEVNLTPGEVLLFDFHTDRESYSYKCSGCRNTPKSNEYFEYVNSRPGKYQIDLSAEDATGKKIEEKLTISVSDR